MPIEIDGVNYFSATDLHQELGVARQTIWRWRKARKIPQGHRYRDRQVVFTSQEATAIRAYANRLEPVELADSERSKSTDQILLGDESGTTLGLGRPAEPGTHR